MSPQARVGLLTLVAAILVVATVVILRGGEFLRRPGYELTILFNDAAGVDVGTPVRMAGVAVGRVRAVRLAPTNQAQVTISVNSDVRIPQGSSFVVTMAGLVGDRFIAIIPGPQGAPEIPPETTVHGEERLTIEGLAKRFEGVADRVEKLVDNLNSLVADPEMRESLRQALRNASEASGIALQTAAAVEQTTRRFQTLMNTDVTAAANDLRQMSRILVDTASRVQAFIDSASGDGATARDLRETAASLRQASERIAQMATDLQGLINPQNVGKAREMVDDARETIREARTVVHRANTVIERVDRIIPSELRIPSLRSLFRLDYEVWYANQRAGHQLDLSLLPEAERFYRLGLHDIGATNGIVLQAGQRFSPPLAGRAGIFESQVGVGVDYGIFDPFLLSIDLYNLNQLTLDAVGRYQVNPNWGITLGGKNLFRQPYILFGIGTNY